MDDAKKTTEESVSSRVVKPKRKQNILVAGAIPELQTLYEENKMLYRFLYSIQKEAISLENIVRNRTLAGQIVSPRMNQLSESLRNLTADAVRILEKEILPNIPIWEKYLKNVKGCGPKLAGSLIGEIKDISRFPTISSLWSYFGFDIKYALAHCEHGHNLVCSPNMKLCPILIPGKETSEEENTDGDSVIKREPPSKCGANITIEEIVNNKAPRRIAGRVFAYNGTGRMITWKLTSQFIKGGNKFYHPMYVARKEREKMVNPEIKLGYAHNKAIRKIGKIFLANLWLNWRVIDGLSIRAPYPIEHMGHETLLLDPAGNVKAIEDGIVKYNATQQVA